MLTYRQILPASETTTYKEKYEYLLVWLSSFGGIRQWLFTSTEGERNEDFKHEIIDNKTTFRSVPNSQDIEISLQTGSLSEDDFNYIADIFESPRIHLVDKFSNQTQIAITGGKKQTPRIIKDFSIELSIKLQEPYLMNV